MIGGALPNCDVQSVSTQCTTKAACHSSIALSCTATDTVPMCTTGTDCAAGDECCTVSVGGQNMQGCVSTMIADLAKLTCD